MSKTVITFRIEAVDGKTGVYHLSKTTSLPSFGEFVDASEDKWVRQEWKDYMKQEEAGDDGKLKRWEYTFEQAKADALSQCFMYNMMGDTEARLVSPLEELAEAADE